MNGSFAGFDASQSKYSLGSCSAFLAASGSPELDALLGVGVYSAYMASILESLSDILLCGQ